MTAHPINEYPAPPLCNLLMPHGNGCPPNCPYRQWVEKYLRPPVAEEE